MINVFVQFCCAVFAVCYAEFAISIFAIYNYFLAAKGRCKAPRRNARDEARRFSSVKKYFYSRELLREQKYTYFTKERTNQSYSDVIIISKINEKLVSTFVI